MINNCIYLTSNDKLQNHLVEWILSNTRDNNETFKKYTSLTGETIFSKYVNKLDPKHDTYNHFRTNLEHIPKIVDTLLNLYGFKPSEKDLMKTLQLNRYTLADNILNSGNFNLDKIILPSGDNLLIHLTRYTNIGGIKWLLSHKVDLTIKNTDNQTAYDVALECQRRKLIFCTLGNPMIDFDEEKFLESRKYHCGRCTKDITRKLGGCLCLENVRLSCMCHCQDECYCIPCKNRLLDELIDLVRPDSIERKIDVKEDNKKSENSTDLPPHPSKKGKLVRRMTTRNNVQRVVVCKKFWILHVVSWFLHFATVFWGRKAI
eukprot:UN32776